MLMHHHHTNTGWYLSSFPEAHSPQSLADMFQRNLKIWFTFTNLLLQLMCFFSASNQSPPGQHQLAATH